MCNASFDCSVFASEEYPGWTAGKSVALCKSCDSGIAITDQTTEVEVEIIEHDTDTKEGEISVPCASRGFYHYHTIWKPKVNQHLDVRKQRV